MTKYKSRQPEDILIITTGRHSGQVANLVELRVKTSFQSIPTPRPAFKEGHTWVSGLLPYTDFLWGYIPHGPQSPLC